MSQYNKLKIFGYFIKLFLMKIGKISQKYSSKQHSDLTTC